MPDNLAIALELLKKKGLPVTPATEKALRAGLAKYGAATSENVIKAVTDNLLEGIRSVANPVQVDGVTQGATPGSLTGDIHQLLADYGEPHALAESMNLRFKIGTATKVSNGVGHFLTDQTDVDEYPAWEFHRIYDREVPRGFKKTKNGLVEEPGEDWPTRWAAAGEASDDDDWLPWNEETDSGIALKSSDIWAQLAAGAGGYTDTLGNISDPVAFNTGYGKEGVPYNECVKLGLIKDGEEPKRTKFDFTKLFSMEGAA